MLSALTLPAAGVAYRVSYLRSHHQVPISPFASGMAVFALVWLLVWGALGILGLISINLRGVDVYQPIIALVTVCTLAIIVAAVALELLRRLSANHGSRVQDLAHDCLKIVSSSRIGFAAFIAILISSITQAVGFYWAFRTFNLSLGLIDSTVILISHQISGVVGITPGAMGIQESVSLFFSLGLGADITEMVIVLALMRVCRMVLSVLVGVPCWWLLSTAKLGRIGSKHVLSFDIAD